MEFISQKANKFYRSRKLFNKCSLRSMFRAPVVHFEPDGGGGKMNDLKLFRVKSYFTHTLRASNKYISNIKIFPSVDKIENLLTRCKVKQGWRNDLPLLRVCRTQNDLPGTKPGGNVTRAWITREEFFALLKVLIRRRKEKALNFSIMFTFRRSQSICFVLKAIATISTELVR